MKLLRLAAPTAALALTAGLSLSSALPATAIDVAACSALRTQTYSAQKPSGATLLTISKSEATNAAAFGYAAPQAFAKFSSQAATDLTPVYRTSRSGTGFAWAQKGSMLDALEDEGYTVEKIDFYAATESSACTKPVYGFKLNGTYRYETERGGIDHLLEEGAQELGVVFYAAADSITYGAPTSVPAAAKPAGAASDSTFTFAVIPDTQNEVYSNDGRLTGRAQWLVSKKASLDLRWAVQTGDLVSWDTSTHNQYEVAKLGTDTLERGHVPYFLNIGNHDTAAVCGPGHGVVPGSACPGTVVSDTVRNTQTMNRYFSTDRYGVPVGSFEPGKIDNTYATFYAGNRKWLMLNLEFLPRKEVVAWAQRVVAAYPDHNVIVATHSFMSSSGSISSKVGYGGTSPRYLYDNLIKKYKNVRFVLSGHVGVQKTKVYTGVHGNKIYSLLTTYHSNTDNPVRLVSVDTSKKTITTKVYSPKRGVTYSSTTVKWSSVSFVR